MKQTIYRALLKLDTSLSPSGFFPLLPLAKGKNCNCQLLDATSLFSLAHSLNMLCTLLFLPRACWPIISTFLSCFDCFLVAELSPLAAHFSRSSLALLIAAKKLTDIFCYCLLACPCCLVLLQIASFDSVLFSIFCFCSLLSRCLCLLFCGQKCGTLCGAQLFDFDCFVLIEMFLQLLPASLPLLPLLLLLLLLRALPRAEAEQRRVEHNC